MNIPIDQILDVFFTAMLNGYAGNSPKDKISEIPGSKTIHYSEGDFKVIDCYFITPYSDYSFGTTTIYYQNNAVWMMQYRGHYPEEIIPFLKQSLLQTYEKNNFVGGRGPVVYNKDDLRYTNVVAISDWRNFSGREEIKQGEDLKGWHEYNGLLLI